MDRKLRVPITVRAALIFLFTLASVGASAAQERIVAIGDVHGSFAPFTGILQEVGLIDSNRKWIGGSAILVQLGDVTNRGTQTRQCLDLLMRLEAQAGEQNGKVISLLGNHEVMSIVGDLRYVLPEDLQAFAGEQSEGLRERAYEEYRAFLRERRKRGRVGSAHDEADREKWREEHPLGFFEFRDAFGPQGLYGRWLRQLDTVAQVGDVLLVHGGLSAGLRFRSIGEINDRVRAEMARFDSIWQSLAEQQIIWRYMKLEEARRAVEEELAATGLPGGMADSHLLQEMHEFLSLPSWIMVSPDGPLWYRGYADEPEDKLARGLGKMMSRLKVAHLVVAHTITDSRRISVRCGGRVFLLDTGMVFEPTNQGRASALEIQNGQFTAHYSNGEQMVLLRREGGGKVPAPGPSGGKGNQKP